MRDLSCSVGFFNSVPIAVVFIAVGLGYLIGKLRIGPVELGGVCGTLIAALLLGQTGCQANFQVKDIAFALFIFAMGYSGGPGFFANLNRSSLRFMVLPLVEAVLVLGIALAAALFFGFDPGTTAGLAAGAATESAVVGTASEALRHLDLNAAQVQQMEANIAIAYSLTYLVGMISIVLFTSQLAPVLLGIDLKRASRELEEKLGAVPEADEANVPALPRLVGRSHLVRDAAGRSVGEIEGELGGRTAVTRIFRNGAAVEPDGTEILQSGDIVVFIGLRRFALRGTSLIGPEIELPAEHADALNMEERKVVVSRKRVNGRTLAELARRASAHHSRGVFLLAIERAGHDLPVMPSTALQYGDVVTLVGTDPMLGAAAERLGGELRRDGTTDLIFLCGGILAGLLIGSLAVTLGGVPLSLGSGGGALVSGLVCGWIAAKRPHIGHIPAPALHLIKELGLAIFIACVGLSAGPQAITLLKEHGLVLPLLGLLVSLGPACASLWIGHKFLKIEGPLLLGAIAGQHVSTPTLSAVIAKAGSPIPILGYTVTYAIANVLLPVLGPLIVALAYHVG
ncbi:aspartate-alanine antiporter [Bordetella genomosp. 1]|uniref:Aspartate-alanine antiporter n=1 Tax=Bordetella genomosp. 1 TaxID=1395607 RepID=A0ABX4F0Z4_9BORD|nr:aspartate-alanine antiporter [Bordetella genomosp. 1]MDQ8035576.1 aspartate-alanine antiporter [Bordetella sp.]OZI65671.1 aspartate-alanine antiporter [Bordetella genomosp. 1]